MTQQPPIRHDPDRLRTLAARGRLVLCGMLVWLAETFGASRLGRAARNMLRDDLMALKRGIAAILILLALPRLAQMRCAQVHGRPNAPRGFRCARRTESLRFALRVLPRAATVRGRIAALAAVLDNLDRWIARMADHIARDVDLVASLVMTLAFADTCATLARVAPAYADSS